MTTIKEVAQEAGVSFKTVSRVINNDPKVHPDTRERVQAAIRALGYRPNLAARHMRTQRSQLIGLLTDEIATTPLGVNIIKGAQEAAWAQNRLLFVVNTEGDRRVEDEAIEMMLGRKVEGILYATMRHRLVEPPPALHEVPSVLIDCLSADGSFSSITPDEEGGGYMATSTLLAQGHRRIGFLNLEQGGQASLGRLLGYQRALLEFNIPYDPDLVCFIVGNAANGYAATCSLLALPQAPTALFCGNDRIAMGAYDALKERGYAIPRDMSVIGYDDHDMVAPYLRPALTTMHLPHDEMGAWAVQHLLAHNPPRLIQQVRWPCPLIERASVAAPSAPS